MKALLNGLATGLGAGVLLQLHVAYYVVLGLIALHFGWQIKTFDLQRPDRNFQLFRANMAAGVVLILACLVGTLLA